MYRRRLNSVPVDPVQRLENFVTSVLIMIGVVLLLSAGGCSGGGGSSSGGGDVANSGDEQGELVLALTDAEGDFLTYEVDVSSIKLTHQNGGIVEALPITTTVDFAQYVELSELLTIATIPSGLYEVVELNLDYSNANVTVQAEDGSALQASLVDGDGNALSQLTVSIELAGDSRFRIAPGIPAQVTLDLDLDASNEVVIDGDDAVVTVEPVLLADTILENPKPFRLRGLLDEVAVEESVFVLDLRPFRHRVRGFGSARVHVDDETGYEINGVVYDATSGLQQLSELAEDTPVVTSGEWDREEKIFTANSVYAGSSVPWGEVDALRGVVTARVDNTLTVRGAIVDFANGERAFHESITVTVGPNTSVTQQLDDLDNATIGDISVGSAIAVIGDVVDAVIDDEASEQIAMDASEGQVRIRLSNLTGSVVTVSPLSVDLQRLSGKNAAIYDFAGTGTDGTSDADPANYDIDTSVLLLSSLNIGEPVKVRGLVTAFGTAPEDFVAQSVLDASDVKAHMVIGYGSEGVTNALSQVSEDGLLFDLTDVSGRSVIIRAGVVTQLAELGTLPLVVPAGEEGVYALTRRGRVEIFRNFAEFAAALNEALANGELVTRFDAHGKFDDVLSQFSSSRLRVGLTQ